jgi:hypothetical protein
VRVANRVAISRCAKRSCRGVKRDCACRSVAGDDLAGQQPMGGVAGADDGGNPYSRATREACAARLPLSVTTAAARAKTSAIFLASASASELASAMRETCRPCCAMRSVKRGRLDPLH